MWSARGGEVVTPEDIAGQAIGSRAQGITLLGGEPFEQADGLARLAAIVRDRGMSVMVFSGFYLRELLQSRERGVAALLAQTDLLVDGPYVADQPDRQRPWVGSTNQGFHFLTDRYRHLEHELPSVSDRIEVRVSASGRVSVNGWAGVQQLDELLSDVTAPIGRGKVR